VSSVQRLEPRKYPELAASLLLSVVVALLPNALALLTGSLSAAIVLALWWRRAGGSGQAALLVIGALGLLPSGWLLLTVAGRLAPSLVSLPEVPLSLAAALWITPWLLLAVWVMLGQWPLQSLVPSPVLGVLAGLLLVRVGVAAVPDGLLGIQAVVAPLVVISLWWAVATQRPAMALGAAGLFGALAAPDEGAVWLLLVFAGVTLVSLTDWFRVRWTSPMIQIVGFVVAAGLWPALEAGLRTQVVYTVLGVAAFAAAGAMEDAVPS
jgi:hypothetical protein